MKGAELQVNFLIVTIVVVLITVIALSAIYYAYNNTLPFFDLIEKYKSGSGGTN